jgi:hypothetical protein
LKSKVDGWRVDRLISKRVSTIFNNLDEKLANMKDESEFEVYFDNHGESRVVKPSDPRLKMSKVSSSVKSKGVYRGFSKHDIKGMHRLSQKGIIGTAYASKMERYTNNGAEEYFGQNSSDDEIVEQNMDLESDSSDSVIEKMQSNNLNMSELQGESRPPKVAFLPDISQCSPGLSPGIVNPFKKEALNEIEEEKLTPNKSGIKEQLSKNSSGSKVPFPSEDDGSSQSSGSNSDSTEKSTDKNMKALGPNKKKLASIQGKI